MANLPLINMMHVFLIAPFLFYIGYQHNYGYQKPSREVYDFLIVLSIIVFVYHGYRIITRM